MILPKHWSNLSSMYWTEIKERKDAKKECSCVLQFKIEKIIKEKEELLKVTSVLEKETTQLRDQVERLEKELNHEKQRCDQLQTEQKVSCFTD